MKELTLHEVKEVSGGWGRLIASFTLGALYGNHVVNPAEDAIRRGFNSFVNELNEMGRRNAAQYMSDPKGYARDHFSFYGDMPHSWRSW